MLIEDKAQTTNPTASKGYRCKKNKNTKDWKWANQTTSIFHPTKKNSS